jgi:hypothetical protein
LIFNKISQIKENATPIGQEQYYWKFLVVHRSSHSRDDGSFNICKIQLLEATWILAGDFNFVESLSDKLGGAPTLGIKRREQEAWDKLILKLQVQDSFTLDEFKKINKRKYTCDKHDCLKDLIIFTSIEIWQVWVARLEFGPLSQTFLTMHLSLAIYANPKWNHQGKVTSTKAIYLEMIARWCSYLFGQEPFKIITLPHGIKTF